MCVIIDFALTIALSLAVYSAQPPEAEILLVKQARHAVRVDTWLCEITNQKENFLVFGIYQDESCAIQRNSEESFIILLLSRTVQGLSYI